MDTTKALELISPKARQRIYLVLVLASLLLTAAGAAYLSSPYAVPWWIAGGLAALGVLVAPFGVLAGGNVQADPNAARPDQTADAHLEATGREVQSVLDRHLAAEVDTNVVIHRPEAVELVPDYATDGESADFVPDTSSATADNAPEAGPPRRGR